jgi:hypothetical protein
MTNWKSELLIMILVTYNCMVLCFDELFSKINIISRLQVYFEGVLLT